MLDSTSVLIHQLKLSLAAGTARKNKIVIDMPTNVFKFLFDGKGVTIKRGYKDYNQNDFDPTLFIDEWCVMHDEHGNGCSIDFPVRMKSCISWTRKKEFTKEKVILTKKLFFERVYIILLKKRV